MSEVKVIETPVEEVDVKRENAQVIAAAIAIIGGILGLAILLLSGKVIWTFTGYLWLGFVLSAMGAQWQLVYTSKENTQAKTIFLGVISALAGVGFGIVALLVENSFMGVLVLWGGYSILAMLRKGGGKINLTK